MQWIIIIVTRNIEQIRLIQKKNISLTNLMAIFIYSF